MLGIVVVEVAAVDGVIDHRVGDHDHILVRLGLGDGLQVLVQPADGFFGIDHRVAAVGHDRQNVIAAHHIMPAFELLGHFGVAHFGKIVIGAQPVRELLGLLVGVFSPLFPDVVIADGIDHGHLLGIEHALIQAFPVVDLGILLCVPGGAVHQVAHHNDGIEPAELLRIVALLYEGAAELVCGHGLVAVHVRIADDGKICDHLFGIEVSGERGDAHKQGRAEKEFSKHF